MILHFYQVNDGRCTHRPAVEENRSLRQRGGALKSLSHNIPHFPHKCADREDLEFPSDGEEKERPPLGWNIFHICSCPQVLCCHLGLNGSNFSLPTRNDRDLLSLGLFFACEGVLIWKSIFLLPVWGRFSNVPCHYLFPSSNPLHSHLT